MKKQLSPHVDHKKNVWFFDGYNIIHACHITAPHLPVSNRLERARDILQDSVQVHRCYYQCDVVLVFDSRYKKLIKKEKNDGMEVVYTTRTFSADNYIERRLFEERKKGTYAQTYVVTGDLLLRQMSSNSGAQTYSPTIWWNMMKTLGQGEDL